MNKAQIIEDLARRRRVETLCKRIAHEKTLTDDLKDLSQGVYLILLEYDEDKLVGLAERGSLIFFIVRIILHQYLNPYGAYRKQVRRVRSIFSELHDIHLTLNDILQEDDDTDGTAR